MLSCGTSTAGVVSPGSLDSRPSNRVGTKRALLKNEFTPRQPRWQKTTTKLRRRTHTTHTGRALGICSHVLTSKTLTMLPLSITPKSRENGSASSLILSGLKRKKNKTPRVITTHPISGKRRTATATVTATASAAANSTSKRTSTTTQERIPFATPTQVLHVRVFREGNDTTGEKKTEALSSTVAY